MGKPAVVVWVLLVGLLVPAGALTWLRLGDPASAVGVQLVAYAPVALVPYLLALVVVLLALARPPTRQVALAVPLALVLAGTALHLVWLLPSFTGSGREPRADAPETVVLSANMLHGLGDGSALVAAAVERRADVLVVSEVTTSTLAQMDAAGLEELMPHRAGTPGELYEGTMVFSREPVEEVVPVEGTRFDNLLVRTGGLEVLAAHPAAPLDPEDWRTDHEVLREVVARHRPDVVIGDLNATLDHAPVRALVSDGYRDSAELLDAGLVPTWPANGLYPVLGLLPPTAPIDHALLAPGWTATATGTVEVPGTDHLAIVVSVARA